MCKDAKKIHFKFKSSDPTVSIDTCFQLAKEYGESHGGEYGKGTITVTLDQLFSKAYTQRMKNFPLLQDAGLLDWVRWGIQTGSYNLNPKILTKSCSLPAEKAAILFEIMSNPQDASADQLAALLIDGPSHHVCNVKYKRKSFADARVMWTGATDDNETTENTYKLDYSDLRGWQRYF